MAICRATVVLNKRSGVPKDASRNVWHFDADGVDPDETKVANGLITFYQGIQGLLAPSIDSAANAHRVELAYVDEGVQGEEDDVVSSLIGTSSFTLGVMTTEPVLPNEAAMTLSFRGTIAGVPEEQGIQRPRSRRRGRVYLGPLNAAVLEKTTTTQEPRFTVAARETVLDAYDAAHAVWAFGSNQPRHAVYSRVNGELYHVLQVSVDNEPDVIRSRGRKASLKMSRPIDPTTAATGRSGTDVALAS